MVDLLQELKQKQNLLAESEEINRNPAKDFSKDIAPFIGFNPYETLRSGKGAAEAAAAIGSQALMEAPSGLVGAAEFATGDAESGAKAVKDFQKSTTYQPSQAGQEQLMTFGENLKELAKQPGIKQLVDSGVSVQDFITNFSGNIGRIAGDPFAATERSLAIEQGRELPARTEAEIKGEAAGKAIGSGILRAAIEGAGLKGALAKPGALSKAVAPQMAKNLPSKVDPKIISNVTKQGFDESVTKVIANASKTDKTKLLKALNNYKKIKDDPRLLISKSLRPSNVAGDSLLERFRVVSKANREAGSSLDSVAKSLRGKKVDQSSAVDQFIRDLDELGVSFDNRMRPNFKGSDIQGSKGAEQLIAKIVTRMKEAPNPDAFQSHRLKKFIDEQVSFGKTAEGLSGKTESIVKSLRRNLDQNLDITFPEYNKVNTVYSETRGAIDALQDAAGRKINLTGKNADAALGTVLRRLMGNAQSRINLSDAIGDLENVAIKQGGKFDDDLATQLLFIDELDRVFGPATRTSLQGQGSQVAERLARGESVKGALFGRALEDIVEKVKGVNEQEAIKALEELLKEAK